MIIGEALVQFKSDATATINALRDVAKGAQTTQKAVAEGAGTVKSASEAASVSVSAMAKGVLLGQAAFAGLKFVGETLVGSLHDVIDEAKATDAIMAQIQNSIQNAGKKAVITSDGAEKMAEKMSLLYPISKNVVLATEQVALRFDKISKKEFPEVIQLATDMAAKLGIDAPTAMNVLGRSMENPGMALRILKQAGVEVTESMKKVLVEAQKTGDSGKAQALIMQALTDKYKGAAAAAGHTFAGEQQKLANMFDLLKEKVGTAVLTAINPYIETLTKWVASDKTQAFIQKVIDKFSDFMKIVGTIGSFIGTSIVPVFGEIRDIFQAIFQGGTDINDLWGIMPSKLEPLFRATVLVAEVLKHLWDDLKVGFSWLVKAFTTDLIPALTTAYDWFGKHKVVLAAVAGIFAGLLVQALVTFITFLYATIPASLAMAGAAIAAGAAALLAFLPWILIGAAVGAAAYEIITHWTEIKKWTSDTWKQLKDDVTSAYHTFVTSTVDTWNNVKKSFRQGVDDVITFFEELPERIIYGLGYVAGVIVRFFLVDIPNYYHAFIAFMKNLPSDVSAIAQAAWSSFTTWISKLWTDGKKTTMDGANSLVDWFVSLPHRISVAVQAMWEAGKSAFDNFKTNAINWAESTIQTIVDSFVHLPSKIVDGVTKGLSNIGNFFSNIGNTISAGFKSGAGALPHFASGVTDFAGGLAMINEQGPELVALPRGASVIPHDKSLQLLNGASSPAQASKTVNISIEAGNIIASDSEIRGFARKLQIAFDEIDQLKGVS